MTALTKSAPVAGVLALGLSIGGPAAAAPTFYFDAAAFDSALAGLYPDGFDTTVETFDMLAPGSQGTNFTGPSGIGFSTATPDTELRVNADPEPSTSGFNTLAQSFTGAGGLFDEQLGFGTVLDIDLGTTTNAFSANLITNILTFLPEDLLVEVNGAGGNITDRESTPIPGSTAEFRFVGVIDPTSAFSDVRMTFGSLTDGFGIGELDDVTYYTAKLPDTPVIPLPAALPLLLGGIGALAMVRRRKG